MVKIEDIKVELVCESELFIMIKELNERLKKLTSDNSSYDVTPSATPKLPSLEVCQKEFTFEELYFYAKQYGNW